MVVCFQPPNFFIGSVYVLEMHLFVCPTHTLETDWWPRACRVTAAQPLTERTSKEFSISAAVWVLQVLLFLYWHSVYKIDHSTLWLTVVGAHWLTLYQKSQGQCFLPVMVHPDYLGVFIIIKNKLIGYVNYSTVIVVVPLAGVWVAVALSQVLDFGKVSDPASWLRQA